MFASGGHWRIIDAYPCASGGCARVSEWQVEQLRNLFRGFGRFWRRHGGGNGFGFSCRDFGRGRSNGSFVFGPHVDAREGDDARERHGNGHENDDEHLARDRSTVGVGGFRSGILRSVHA